MQPEGSLSSAPQKAPRYVLALDLGSGSIKAAVVSNAGIVVSVAAEPVTTQIHADVLNVPIHQVEDPVNATVRGCALLALTALGALHPDEISKTIRIRRVFNPDSSNRAVYDKMYTQYRRLFTKNRRIFSALNK